MDISDCGPDPVSSDTATASGTNVVEGTVQHHADAVVDTSMSVVDTNAAVQQSSQATNHSITAAVNRESSGFGPPSSLRHAVAAVVCADQRDREKCAKTVIMSGLAPSQVDGDAMKDALIFQRLCLLEFRIDPSITYTRWLGAAGGERVRPLLVGLQTVGDVSVILSQAKKLQASANEATTQQRLHQQKSDQGRGTIGI